MSKGYWGSLLRTIWEFPQVPLLGMIPPQALHRDPLMFGDAHTHSSSKKPSMLRLSELFRDQGFRFRVARCAACAARLLVQKKRRAGNDPFVLHSPADRHVQLGLRARAKAAKWQTWNQESPFRCSSTYQKTCTAWGNIPPELHTSLQLATHAGLL